MRELARLHALAATVTVLLATPWGAIAAGAEDQRVMLQGTSADRLRTLVEASGGRVTHYLPLIDAVGALLTAEQLTAIGDKPGVLRIIDDLDQEAPETAPPECLVAGALELETDAHGYRWRIYNKGASPVTVDHLELAWPRRLGDLTALTLADVPLLRGPQPHRGTAQRLRPRVPAQVPAQSISPLRLSFRHRPDTPATQPEFDVRLSLGESCEVELIPGYADTEGDSYYPTVAGADLFHRHGITGDGVTVAVLDSGLWDDPRLTQDTRGEHRVLASYDAIANEVVAIAEDESGHGSHMTSILARSSPVERTDAAPGSFQGIAPDARLVVVKAFDRAGKGDMLDIVRGVQWLVQHRQTYDIRVLNLSFAARPRWPYWLDPINQAVMRAWEAGITVIAAAGNEGPEPMSIGSPGNLPYVITVGAVTDSWTTADRRDDYLPDFSSRGPTPSGHIKPDLVAPGGHMSGLTRPGSTLTQEFPEYLLGNGDFVMTGTSQAAALVSGLAALLLQMEPGLTPDAVKCKFKSTADPAISVDGRLSYSPFAQGAGYVSLQRAVTLGDVDCANDGLDLASDIAGEAHFQGPAVLRADGSATLPGLDTMVTGTPPEKGKSATRRWGIKAHIERNATTHATARNKADADLPFDWLQLYTEEKARMEMLRRAPDPAD